MAEQPTIDRTDYGNDISTFVDGVPDLSEDVEIDGPVVVGEGVARALTMHRGSLFYARGRGFNVLDLVNHDPAPGELAREQELAKKEALAVEGVLDADVSITLLDRILRVKVDLITTSGARLQVAIGDAVSVLVLQDQ